MKAHKCTPDAKLARPLLYKLAHTQNALIASIHKELIVMQPFETTTQATREPVITSTLAAQPRSRFEGPIFISMLMMTAFNLLVMAGQIGTTPAIAAPVPVPAHACGAPLA